jgi:hypothetical protein
MPAYRDFAIDDAASLSGKSYKGCPMFRTIRHAWEAVNLNRAHN